MFPVFADRNRQLMPPPAGSPRRVHGFFGLHRGHHSKSNQDRAVLQPQKARALIPGEGNMKISTKGRYALRLMLDLALHNTGEYISLRDVSGRQDITVKYLEQIVTSLTRAGLLRSQRGMGGGYMLARTPAEYTIGEILRVMEGSLEPIACLESDVNLCARSEACSVLPFWKGLSRVINDYVDSYTLQDLVDTSVEMAGSSYVI